MVEAQHKLDTDAVASEEYITALSRRVEVLERKLLRGNVIKEDQPPLKPTLEAVNDKLVGMFEKPDQSGVSILWSKIATLDKVLDPKYISNLKLSDSAKSELLLGYASQLQHLSKPIKELQQLKDYLNLTEFQGLDNHEKNLAPIAKVHSEQELQMESISHQVTELMSSYSKLVLQLSAQLVECGETVSRLESKQ